MIPRRTDEEADDVRLGPLEGHVLMKGAYCLRCREDGPDLVIAEPVGDLPLGARFQMAFTCERCGLRWEWSATKTETGLRWEAPKPNDRR